MLYIATNKYNVSASTVNEIDLINCAIYNTANVVQIMHWRKLIQVVLML